MAAVTFRNLGINILRLTALVLILCSASPVAAARLKWTFTAPGSLDAPVIGPDGTIYVVSDSKTLYSLAPGGHRKWSFKVKGQLGGLAVAHDGTLYLNDGTLIALTSRGTRKWSCQIRGDSSFAPAIGLDGTIYVPGSDALLYAVNPGGKVKWRFESKSGAWGPLAIGPDGTVYVSALLPSANQGPRGSDGLYAIDRDGHLKWKVPDNGNSFYALSTGVNGSLYAGGNYAVFAFSPQGDLERKFPSKGEIDGEVGGAPAVGSDGTIYLVSRPANNFTIPAFHFETLSERNK